MVVSLGSTLVAVSVGDELGGVATGPDIAATDGALASTPVDVDDSPTTSTTKTLRRARATPQIVNIRQKLSYMQIMCN
jgi:hypothetical protein